MNHGNARISPEATTCPETVAGAINYRAAILTRIIFIIIIITIIVVNYGATAMAFLEGASL
jgi:hypothetical protein